MAAASTEAAPPPLTLGSAPTATPKAAAPKRPLASYLPSADLRPALVVARRELGAYFATPVATVFIVVFLALAGVLTFGLGNFFADDLFASFFDGSGPKKATAAGGPVGRSCALVATWRSKALATCRSIASPTCEPSVAGVGGSS